MRAFRRSALGMTALVAGLLSVHVSLGGAAQVPAQPAANLAAFRGQGLLAFVANGRLSILDGGRGALRTPALPAGLSHPAWSPDGRWLAALRWRPIGGGRLWLVQANGANPHPVTSLPGPVTTFAWSPATDTLAAVTAGPHGVPHDLWLVRPGAGAQNLVRNLPWVGDILWSPHGRSLAYVATLPSQNPENRSDAIFTVPAGGGVPVRRFVYSAGVELAGWWPNGKGLLFWLDPMHSASIAADGLGLYTQSFLGGPAGVIQETLLYPEWLTWSASHRNLVFVRGGFRQVWHNKTLYRADTALWGSTPLHRVRGTVQLDPAFSPNGKQIAFVQARDIGATYLNGVANLRGWIRTRRLWVMNAAGSGAHEVSGAGPGVYSPMWSRDGRHILYVRRRAIWLIDAKRNAATQIVRLSPRSDLWPGDAYGDYYGYTAWSNFLAWYKR